MQEVHRPVESSGGIAFREGLIIAAILVVVHIILILVEKFVPVPLIVLLALLLRFILWLVAFFIAGIRAAKRTGLASTGSLAGLWTALFAGIVGIFVEVGVNMLALDENRQTYQEVADSLGAGIVYTNELFIGSVFLGGICLTLLGIGIGAGLGALGGLIGRKQARVYPYGYPYPPQPPYPHQPPRDQE